VTIIDTSMASRYSHICASSDCGCGLTRRDMLRLGALATASVAGPLLTAGDARAQAFKGDDQPVKIGYLPITDATPLLVAHGRKMYEAEGLRAEAPRLFRSWAQIVEAFVSGQVNVIHLLTPAALWVRYGSKFPAKIVAWNHVNGSALTVAPSIKSVADLGGRTVAIPFWYSIHNVLLQQILSANNLVAITRSRDAKQAPNEVNLIVMPPAEMVSALAAGSIAGFIVAEPFNAAAEIAGVGKVLRFSGDVWKNHACCVTFLAERDLVERPEWAQRVTTAIVKAQLWTRENQTDAARMLSNTGEGRYTPHPLRTLTKSAGMRLVFKSLTLSLAAMGNLSVICLLFIFVFAILGVQLFAGKFYSCNDGGVPNRGACTGAPRCTCRIAELLSALPPAPSSPRSAACATGC